MNYKFAMLLFSSLFFLGCNGDTDFGAGGASMGGSGTGGYKPDGSNNANPETQDPEIKSIGKILHKIIFPAVVEQNCEGVERYMQFVQTEFNTPVAGGTSQILSESDKEYKAKLQIVINNTTDKFAYEYVDECHQPVYLLDQQGNNINNSQQFTCSAGESVQVYKPHECKTFTFEFTVPAEANQWILNYPSQYSWNAFEEKQDRTQCAALETNLSIQSYSPGMISDSNKLVVPVKESPCIQVITPPLILPAKNGSISTVN